MNLNHIQKGETIMNLYPTVHSKTTPQHTMAWLRHGSPREPIRNGYVKLLGHLLLVSIIVAITMIQAPSAQAATTHQVAYVFDFRNGVNDSLGSSNGTVQPGSSIFTNVLTTGTPLPNGGTYNGATFTNVPIATIDANPTTALSGFDTVLLYQLCSIASHPTALNTINTFLINGGKVIILDGDRCAPGESAGPADWSNFLFPFTTHGPGPTGGNGSYTFLEASTLTAGLSLGPQPNDAVADANVFTSAVGAWCTSITATNLLGDTGRVEAYARTTNGGLAIYSGEDFWFTYDMANAHLKTVFDNILAQAFNPDGLPCTNPSTGIKLEPLTATNPIGTSHTVTATVVDINGAPQAGVVVTFSVTNGPDAGLTGTSTTNGSGHATFTITNTTTPGTDVIVACFTDGSGVEWCSNEVQKTWVDATAPVAACVATTNPAGKKIPRAGNNPKSGQNPDGFYELTVTDQVDPNPQIFIHDSGSSFVAGPYDNGTKIKLVQAPGAKPRVKRGAGVIDWKIKLKGDAFLVAVDASGNVADPVPCLVPPPPK